MDSIENAYSVYQRDDYVLAARLFHFLAEQGDEWALFSLGNMYLSTFDFIRAYMLFYIVAATSSGKIGKHVM